MSRLIWTYVALLAFVTSAFGQQGYLATQPERGFFASTSGVRHLLHASLSVDCDPDIARKCNQVDADLRLTVRVSDHAPDSDFLGSVVTRFRGRGSGQGPRTIWRDSKCHRYRGFPKVTVIGIEGTLSRESRTTDIAAVTRQIGKPLPADEIVVISQLTRPSSGIAQLTVRARTTASRLVFDLRVETRRCRLALGTSHH